MAKANRADMAVSNALGSNVRERPGRTKGHEGTERERGRAPSDGAAGRSGLR